MRDWLSPRRRGLPLRRGLPRRRDHRARTARRAQVEMVSSQDAAIAAALRRAGLRRQARPRGRSASTTGTPADGKLEVRDILLEVDGTPVTTAERRGRRRSRGAPGRAAGPRSSCAATASASTVEVTPDGAATASQRGRHPARDRLRRSRSTSRSTSTTSIGGPSAGLMFSLAIYDTLTPGSLTGGAGRRRHRHHRRRRQGRPDRRHPAEDRRRPRRRRRAVPGAAGQLRRRRWAPATATCAWSRPTPCTTRSHAIEAWVETTTPTLPTCEGTVTDA